MSQVQVGFTPRGPLGLCLGEAARVVEVGAGVALPSLEEWAEGVFSDRDAARWARAGRGRKPDRRRGSAPGPRPTLPASAAVPVAVVDPLASIVRGVDLRTGYSARGAAEVLWDGEGYRCASWGRGLATRAAGHVLKLRGRMPSDTSLEEAAAVAAARVAGLVGMLSAGTATLRRMPRARRFILREGWRAAFASFGVRQPGRRHGDEVPAAEVAERIRWAMEDAQAETLARPERVAEVSATVRRALGVVGPGPVRPSAAQVKRRVADERAAGVLCAVVGGASYAEAARAAGFPSVNAVGRSLRLGRVFDRLADAFGAPVQRREEVREAVGAVREAQAAFRAAVGAGFTPGRAFDYGARPADWRRVATVPGGRVVAPSAVWARAWARRSDAVGHLRRVLARARREREAVRAALRAAWSGLREHRAARV